MIHKNLISKISKPDHRFETIDYYQEGKNKVLGQVIHVTANDSILYRVKEKKEPVGIHTEPITTYQFIYKKTKAPMFMMLTNA